MNKTDLLLQRQDHQLAADQMDNQQAQLARQGGNPHETLATTPRDRHPAPPASVLNDTHADSEDA